MVLPTTKATASASVSRTVLVVAVRRSALCNISCAYVVLNISALMLCSQLCCVAAARDRLHWACRFWTQHNEMKLAILGGLISPRETTMFDHLFTRQAAIAHHQFSP